MSAYPTEMPRVARQQLIVVREPLPEAARYQVRNPEHINQRTCVTLRSGLTQYFFTDHEGLLRTIKIERGRSYGDPQIEPEAAEAFHQAGWQVRPYGDDEEVEEEVVPVHGDDPFATTNLPLRATRDSLTPMLAEQAAQIAALQQQNSALTGRLDQLLALLTPQGGAELTTVVPAALPPAPTVAEVTGKKTGARRAEPAGDDETKAAGKGAVKPEALAGVPQG